MATKKKKTKKSKTPILSAGSRTTKIKKRRKSPRKKMLSESWGGVGKGILSGVAGGLVDVGIDYVLQNQNGYVRNGTKIVGAVITAKLGATHVASGMIGAMVSGATRKQMGLAEGGFNGWTKKPMQQMPTFLTENGQAITDSQAAYLMQGQRSKTGMPAFMPGYNY